MRKIFSNYVCFSKSPNFNFHDIYAISANLLREKMPKSSRGKRTKRENELGGRICQYPKREKMPKFQRGTLFQGDIMPKSPRGRGFKRELLPKCLRG
jgi:hypothetical protein